MYGCARPAGPSSWNIEKVALRNKQKHLLYYDQKLLECDQKLVNDDQKLLLEAFSI
jgi:hypothetical protein